MSDKKDTKDIIKEFLELWQKQFAYMSRDPETVTYMLKMFSGIQEGYAESIKKGMSFNAQPNASSDIFRHVNDELCKLSERVADIEKRIAKLESPAGKRSSKSKKTTTRKRSKRAVG